MPTRKELTIESCIDEFNKIGILDGWRKEECSIDAETLQEITLLSQSIEYLSGKSLDISHGITSSADFMSRTKGLQKKMFQKLEFKQTFNPQEHGLNLP